MDTFAFHILNNSETLRLTDSAYVGFKGEVRISLESTDSLFLILVSKRHYDLNVVGDATLIEEPQRADGIRSFTICWAEGAAKDDARIATIVVKDGSADCEMTLHLTLGPASLEYKSEELNEGDNLLLPAKNCSMAESLVDTRWWDEQFRNLVEEGLAEDRTLTLKLS